MMSMPDNEQYKVSEWIDTTPIVGMFNGDNSAVLTEGNRGVLVPRAQNEDIFNPAKANKVIAYGLIENSGVVVVTDSRKKDFLVAEINLHKGLQDDTMDIVAKMESPAIVLIDHKMSPYLRKNGDAQALLHQQFEKKGIMPFIRELQLLPDGSADVAFMNWKGTLHMNVRSTGGGGGGQ